MIMKPHRPDRIKARGIEEDCQDWRNRTCEPILKREENPPIKNACRAVNMSMNTSCRLRTAVPRNVFFIPADPF